MQHKPKVILAYSGGLDTTVCIRYLSERYGMEVAALLVDVGQGADLRSAAARARASGVTEVVTVDARERFVTEYAWPCLRANAAYQGKYLLSAALSRPLIASLLVEQAHRSGAQAVAHGCTGKGNDQVRFDLTVRALDPALRIIAPIRELALSRDASLEYARTHGIPVEGKGRNPFSIDANLWGRSIECGVLEDPWQEPPEEAFSMTSAPAEAPDRPATIDIEFRHGLPVALDGRRLGPVNLVQQLNEIGGAHGVGRVDHIEDRLVGIKSREVYEAPAAHLLHLAHRDLESLTLTAETLRFKRDVDARYAELVYGGRWLAPLRSALDAFVEETQKSVNGYARLKLYRGSVAVVGRQSDQALYERALATYEGKDAFNQAAAEGFIELYGLDLVTLARRARRAAAAPAAHADAEPAAPRAAAARETS
jgi:argininosuccinate synthase